MHIFIDESGVFAHSSGSPGISAVGALIVPDERLPQVERKYLGLRPNLPKQKGEVKGKLLSEQQIDRIASMLVRNEVLFEVTAIDLAMHRGGEIAAHQAMQVKKIGANVTDDDSPHIRAWIQDLRARLERTSPQLYVQTVLTFDVIARVLDHATLYYSQRRPRELGMFHWVIDAKERSKIIDWEQWWSLMVIPWLQSKSMREPMPIFEGGDYSFFRRFDREAPEYWKDLVDEPDLPEIGTDIRKVMTESFRFSANAEPGLELVDILTNATRRALVGNLRSDGWRTIPRLMIHTREPYIGLVSFNKIESARPPYAPVVRAFTRGGRTMIAPRFK